MNKTRSVLADYHLGRLLYILLVIGLFLATFIGQFPHRLQFFVLLLAWLPVVWGAVKGLQEKKIGSELFFVFATVIALIGHEEQAITVVLIVVMIAGYLERLVEERTERAIESLIRFMPSDVLVRLDSREEWKPISEVRPDTQIVVKTGSRQSRDFPLLACPHLR